MNKYYIISIDGITLSNQISKRVKETIKFATRKEATNYIDTNKPEFSDDITIYFVVETDRKVTRKMVDVILSYA